jgi:LuxR family transcriptional regulator, maltose regulon positive regulatory protein
VASLLNPVPAQRARLLLTQGDVAAANRWVKERGLAADDEVRYPREGEYLVLARVLLAHGRSDQALGLLERMHTQAVAQARAGSVIEARTLQALALADAGDQPRALAALAEALALGAPEGYLRVFADEGLPMAGLLGRLVRTPAKAQAVAAAQVPRAYLGRVLEAFERAGLATLPPSQAGGTALPGLVMPLSVRELEVLGLLAAGKPNQTIAEELVITLDTVKRHVTHILDKLGAANRTQAVARARALGLLR